MENQVVLLQDKIKQLEIENAVLKTKLECYEQEKTGIYQKIERMDEIAEKMYTYEPMLEYIGSVSHSFYQMLPAVFRRELPAPEFDT